METRCASGRPAAGARNSVPQTAWPHPRRAGKGFPLGRSPCVAAMVVGVPPQAGTEVGHSMSRLAPSIARPCVCGIRVCNTHNLTKLMWWGGMVLTHPSGSTVGGTGTGSDKCRLARFRDLDFPTLGTQLSVIPRLTHRPHGSFRSHEWCELNMYTHRERERGREKI